MKILQIMGYSLEEAYQYKKNGHEYQGHHFYGFDFFKEQENVIIKCIIPNYNNKFLQFISKSTGLGNELMRLQLQVKCVRESKDYDLIYSPQDIHIPLLALLRILHICKKPIFSISHFAYNSKLIKNRFKKKIKKIERTIIYKGIDKISFLNETLLELAIEDYNVPIRHRNFVNWAADLEFFRNYVAKMQQPPTNDYFVAIGSANRDYNTLVRAFSNIDIPLKILGRKDESLSITGKIPENVFFENSIKPGLDSVAQLRKYYYNAIAILIPILNDNDVSNGATVFIEALAMGKPIIITDLRTNYIDVEKEGIGFKVKRGDIKGWIKAIGLILNSPIKTKGMGDRALKLAEISYNYSEYNKLIYFQIQNELKLNDI